MDFGAITLAIAVLGVIGWLTFLVTQSRVRRRREPAPQNLSPFMTDDELESKRLNRILVSALISTAVLAIVMPIYYLNEADRQVHAAEVFDEIAVERGEHWFEEFQCGNCHGVTGGGGGANFVEARSGIQVAWAAPPLNDILYRYDEEEVRFWIVWGRQGSPMPAWGIEGGGPLNSQQVDELLAYIEYIQISQDDAVAQVEGKLGRELTRLAGADEAVADAQAAVETRIDALADAPGQYEAITPLRSELSEVLAGAGTCTEETAMAVDLPCTAPAADTDRDGISDTAEVALNDVVSRMAANAPRALATMLGGIAFDPENAFTTSNGASAVPDLDQIETVVDELEAIERDLRLTLENAEALLESELVALDFVKEAATARRWAIDFDAIAAAGFEGSVADAQRAAALYNAYCARCHTAGYSAGVAFTQEVGSGALGPSLRDGRSSVQFPDMQSHLDFIVKGSVNGQAYGVNGIGRGWMPGFGTVLSERDLMLIVDFERALR